MSKHEAITPELPPDEGQVLELAVPGDGNTAGGEPVLSEGMAEPPVITDEEQRPDTLPDEQTIEAEETPAEVEEATVARKGLGKWLAERRAEFNSWRGSRQAEHQRAEKALAHAAEEHSLALEALGRLDPDHTPSDLRSMIETVRQERAERAASEAEQKSVMTEAARLEAEAARLDQVVEREAAPAVARANAAYEKLRPGFEAAWQALATAVQARDEYQRQAAALREQAAGLRAPYEDAAPATEPLAA